MPMKQLHTTLVGTLSLLCILLLAACSGDDKKQDAAQQGPIPMKVVKAESRDMPIWSEFVGQTSAVETVEVRARVAGFLDKMLFKEGSTVKKGDLLFVIDPKTFQEDLKQAKSQLEYNQAKLTKAQKDLARFKKLFEEGVVSRDEYESYETGFATMRAQVSENKAQVENANIQLGYTKIYSPIDGVIGRVNVDVGNLVGQGENTLLATVSTDDPMYVTFSISEAEYVKYMKDRMAGKENTPATFKLVLADGTEYNQDGTFSMADRAIDPTTGTLGIRVSFPNPDHLLRPGQYAKVRVLGDHLKDAVVIPSRAIVDTQGIQSLFVVGADGKLDSRPVTVKFERDGLSVIGNGLAAGDMVIVDGIQRVKPGMEIKPIVVPMETPDKDGEQTAPTAKQGE